MMKHSWIITIVAIGAITALLMTALLKGINGTLLAGGLIVIAGLGGYQIKNIREFIKKK